MLGATRCNPDERALDGIDLRLRWLRDTFGVGPPPDATKDVVRNFARAYIIALIGVALFADKSGNQVRLFLLPLLRDLEEADLFHGEALFLHGYTASCFAPHLRIGHCRSSHSLTDMGMGAHPRWSSGETDRVATPSGCRHGLPPRSHCT